MTGRRFLPLRMPWRFLSLLILNGQSPVNITAPESQIERLTVWRGLPANTIGFSGAVGPSVSASEREEIQGQKSFRLTANRK